ncbi:MAG: hypothetical protein ACOX8F_11435, partial [Sakamotonia sp.]
MGSKAGSGGRFRSDGSVSGLGAGQASRSGPVKNNESEEDLMYEFLEKYLPRDKRVRMGILMAADVL